MPFVNLLFLTTILISMASCNWRETNKKSVDKSVVANKDTTRLLNVIKRYEPAIYKGTVPKAFYTNRGAYDWWRFPLVYPYSIGCIDVTEYGMLYSDKDKTNYDEGGSMQPLSDYFDKFVFDKSSFIARKTKSPFDPDTINFVDEYFIFSFSNGTTKTIKGTDNLKKKLKEIKFTGDTIFMTIKNYSDRL